MRFIDTSKKICCDDVIRCIFDFNNLDIKVYKKLKIDGESSAQDLAIKLNKERSTVYRSLQKLNNCGLCKKITNKISTGGHYYTYNIIESKLIKNKIESCINDWYKTLKETINILDKE